MANDLHIDFLKQGTIVWNQWRTENPSIQPDLSRAVLINANLSKMNLSEVDFNGADLTKANLMWSNLYRANLNGAHLKFAHILYANLQKANLFRAYLKGAILINSNLSEANLSEANLRHADLSDAILNSVDLSKANLSRAGLLRAKLNLANLIEADLNNADLSMADLTGTDLSGADLRMVRLIETNFEKANLSGCSVYGISAWNLKLEVANQSDLIITQKGESIITVDNLEVAQFIYLLLNNEKIRDVVDTISSKVVLILGRFSPERKMILDAIKGELRRSGYLPILFDFGGPTRRNLTETVSILAHMAKFIIADITDAKSIPQELMHIVPNLPSVPVQPLVQVSAETYSMFEHFKNYPWVLEIYQYNDIEDIRNSFNEKIIDPAKAKAMELK